MISKQRRTEGKIDLVMQKKRKQKCDNCEKSEHIKEKCWNLHGRPTQGHGGGHLGNTKSHAHMTEASEDSPQSHAGQPFGFSNEEMQASS